MLLRGLFFQAWGSLTSLKSQTRDPQLKVPPRGLVLRIFTSWKNPSTSAGFEPANLGSQGEHVTPRLPRPTSIKFSVILSYKRINWNIYLEKMLKLFWHISRRNMLCVPWWEICGIRNRQWWARIWLLIFINNNERDLFALQVIWKTVRRSRWDLL